MDSNVSPPNSDDQQSQLRSDAVSTTSETSVKISSSRKGRLRNNLIWQFVLQAGKYAFPLVTLPYLTRVLGPDSYAVRAFVVSAMTVIQVFLEFGFTPFGTEKVAKGSAEKRTFSVVISAVTYSKLSLSSYTLLFYFGLAQLPLLAGYEVFLAISCLGVVAKALLPDFFYLGIQQMGFLTRRFMATQIVATVLIFVVVRGADDMVWLAVIESGALILALLWSYSDILFRRRIGFVRVALGDLGAALRGALEYFVSIAAATFFAAGTTLLVGIVITDERQIAYWAVAMTAIGAIQSLYTPVTNSLFPYVVATQSPQVIFKALWIGVPVTILLAGGLVWQAPLIVRILGGAEYSNGANVLRVLALLVALSYPTILIGLPLLGAFGKVNLLNRSTVLAATVHVIGLVVLIAIGSFNLITVATVRIGSECVLLLLRVYFASRVLRALN